METPVKIPFCIPQGNERILIGFPAMGGVGLDGWSSFYGIPTQRIGSRQSSLDLCLGHLKRSRRDS